jgi:SAM-dependent methyltransferase
MWNFPLFVPHSSGSYNDLAQLTVKAANQTFPFIVQLIETMTNSRFEEPVPIETFSNNQSAKAAAAELKLLFDKYGSDKATEHDYYHLYGSILSNRSATVNILEVGLGTTNKAIASNMGLRGSPGASLRAFSEFLPNAVVYGADVDRQILFSQQKIKTFFVDQTELQSFDALAASVDCDFDLVIDDGLHSPNANIATLIFAYKKLKRGGWFVVEDISLAALPVWRVVGALLPADYKSWIVAGKGGFLFAMKRNTGADFTTIDAKIQ